MDLNRHIIPKLNRTLMRPLLPQRVLNLHKACVWKMVSQRIRSKTQTLSGRIKITLWLLLASFFPATSPIMFSKLSFVSFFSSLTRPPCWSVSAGVSCSPPTPLIMPTSKYLRRETETEKSFLSQMFSTADSDSHAVWVKTSAPGVVVWSTTSQSVRALWSYHLREQTRLWSSLSVCCVSLKTREQRAPRGPRRGRNCSFINSCYRVAGFHVLQNAPTMSRLLINTSCPD